MDKILDGIFREIGRLPTDGSFCSRVVSIAKKKYQNKEFDDDAFLHSLNFIGQRYGKMVDAIIVVALKYDEEGTNAAVMALFDQANADGVPVEVYGFFLNRLLAYCGFRVDPTKYKSLAAYDPKNRLVSETLGSYTQNATDLVIDSSKGAFNRYIGKAKAVIVPTGITSVGESAFAKNGVQFVCLPDTVKTIGKNAFEGCVELIDVRLPRGLSEIRDNMLKDAQKCSLFCTTGIKTVGKSAFAGSMVPFGPFFGDVEVFDERAFADDKAVQAVRLGAKTKSVGPYAFMNCVNMATLVAEGDVEIGSYAFQNTQKLTSAEFLGSHTVLRIGTFAQSHLFSFRFNGGVIGNGAFNQCSGLAKVQIEGKTEIEPKAFAGLSGLTNLSFGDGEVHVGANAFQGCGATSITFKDVMIDSGAFAGCGKLSSLRFDGLAKIGPSAFEGDLALRSVTFNGDVLAAPRSFANCGFDTLTLNNGKFDEACFADNANLKEVSIATPDLDFHPGVFQGCKNIQTLKLPCLNSKSGHPFFALFGRKPYANAMEIKTGRGAFYAHPIERLALKDVFPGDGFPEGAMVHEIYIERAKTIPADLFKNVKGLKSIVLGPAVEEIEPGFSIEGVKLSIDPKNANLVQENGLLLTKDKKTVLLVLDPSKLTPANLKNYERIGATIFQGVHFPRFLFGKNSPIFARGVFRNCEFDELVIEDWSKISDETLIDCTVKNIIVKDAKGTPVFLNLINKPEIFDTPRCDRSFSALAFRGPLVAKQLIVRDATINEECDFGNAEVTLEKCTLTGSILNYSSAGKLLLKECHINGASISQSTIADITLENCDGQGFDLAESKIEKATVISAKPVSLSLLHKGSEPCHIQTLHVQAPVLQGKESEPIEIECLELEVPAFEEDALHGLYGRAVHFLTPVTSVNEFSFAYSSFEEVEIAPGSCFVSRGKENYLVDDKGIAFHVIDSNVKRIAFNNEIKGYSPSLFATLRDNVEMVIIASGADVTKMDFQGFSSISRVSTGNLPMPLGDLFPDSPIQEVIFTDDVVGDNFFEGLPGLTKVLTSAPLRRLGFRAFADCARLVEIQGLEGVEEVGDWCFAGDAMLQEANLQEAKVLGAQPFYGCAGLERLTVDADAFKGKPLASLFSNMPYRGGVKVTIGALEYFVPSRLNFIKLKGVNFCDGFFNGFSSAEVEFLDKPVKVGDDAFADAGTIHGDFSQLEEAGERAFAGCWMEEKLILSRIRLLKSEAFARCGALKSVQIGPYLSVLASDAFADFRFESIQDFVVEPAVFRIQDCCLYEGERLRQGFDVVEFPERLVLAPGVRSLEAGALCHIRGLKELDLNNLETMQAGAIADNPNLRSIRFGSKLYELPLIHGTSNLEAIEIDLTPALCHVQKLTDVLEDVRHIEKADVRLLSLPEGYLQGTALKEFRLTLEHAKELPADAFAFPSLQKLTLNAPLLEKLPERVLYPPVYLEELDLLECKHLQLKPSDLEALAGLKDVSLGLLTDNVDKLFASSALNSVRNLKINCIPAFTEGMFSGLKAIENIEIVENPSVIAPKTFQGVPASTIAFGKPVTEVGDEAFQGCKNLQMPPEFFQSITIIGNAAFEDAPKLSEVITFDALSKVGDRAFAKVESLRKVIVSKAAKIDIGEDAFQGCRLETVDLGCDARFGSRCFAHCFPTSGSVLVRGHLLGVGERVFEGCDGLTLLYAHKSDIDSRKGNDAWKQFKDFGKAPGLFGKLFHPPYIKLKKLD